MTTRQKKKLLKRRYRIDSINRNINIKRTLDMNYVQTRWLLRDIGMSYKTLVEERKNEQQDTIHGDNRTC